MSDLKLWSPLKDNSFDASAARSASNIAKRLEVNDNIGAGGLGGLGGRGFGGLGSGLNITKAEQQQQAIDKRNKLALEAGQQAVAQLKAQGFANMSRRNQEKAIADYNKRMQEYARTNQTHIDNPELSEAVVNKVRDSLNELYNSYEPNASVLDEYTNIPYLRAKFGEGVDAYQVGLQKTILDGVASQEKKDIARLTNEKESALKDQDLLIQGTEQEIAQLQQQSAETGVDYSSQIQKLTDRLSKQKAAKDSLSKQYDADIAKVPQTAEEDFYYGTELLDKLQKKSEANTEERRKYSNKFNQDLLEAMEDASDDKILAHIRNASSSTRALLGAFAESLPYTLTSIGAAIAGRQLPSGTARGLVWLSEVIAGVSDVNQDILASVLDAPIDRVKQIDGYDKAYKHFIDNGKSVAEAEQLSRLAIALKSTDSQSAIAALPTAVSAFMAPVMEFLPAKANLMKSVFNKIPIGSKFSKAFAKILSGTGAKEYAAKADNILRATARGGAEAFVEGAEEAGQKAVANYLTNQALGTDTPLTQGTLDAFLLGGIMGGTVAGAGMAVNTAIDSNAPMQVTGDEALRSKLNGNTTDFGGTDTAGGSQLSGPNVPGGNGGGAAGAQQTGTTGTTGTGQSWNSAQAQQSSTNQSAYQDYKTNNFMSQSFQEKTQALQTHLPKTNAEIQSMIQSGENFNISSLRNDPTRVQTLVTGLQTIEALHGIDQVNQYLSRVNILSQGKINLTYDELVDLYATQLAEAAQQAYEQAQSQEQTQPSGASAETATPGGTNGNYTGTVTGTGAGYSGTANTQQAGANAAQPQDTSGNIRSGATTEGAGISGTTRQDTRSFTPNVSSDQSATEQSGQGTTGRRDSTGYDSEGTQSDTGTGSNAGTTEQRTGDVGRTEETSRIEQARADVVENKGNAVESTNSFLDTLEEPATTFEQMYNEMYEQMRSVTSSDAEATFYTNLYMRMATTLSQIIGKSVASVFPVKVKLVHTKGRESGHFDNDHNVIYITETGVEAHTAVAHEVSHAFVETAIANKAAILQAAANGNSAAQQFIEDFTNFAISLGMDPTEDPFSPHTWNKRRENGTTLHENNAIGMERYVAEGQFTPESELSSSYNRIADTIRKAYERTLKSIRQYYNTVKALLQKLAERVPYDELVRFIRESVNSNELNYITTYARPNVEYYDKGLPPQAKRFFDAITSGYESEVDVSVVTPAISGSGSAVIDMSANALSNEFIRTGMTPGDAMDRANDIMRRSIALFRANPTESAQIREEYTHRFVDQLFEANPNMLAVSTPQFAGDMHALVDPDSLTDSQITDMLSGRYDPEAIADGTVNNPMYPIEYDVRSDPSSVVGVPTIEETYEELETLSNDIINVIEEGYSDEYIDPTTQQWFSEFFADGGIADESGTPIMFYRNGNVLSTEPHANILETSVYARSNVTINNKEDLKELDLTEEQKSRVSAIMDKFEKQLSGKGEIDLSDIDANYLFTMGIDSLHGTRDGADIYFLSNLFNSSDIYQDYGQGALYSIAPPDLKDVINSFYVADKVVKLIDEHRLRNSYDVLLQQQNVSMAKAALKRTGYTPAQPECKLRHYFGYVAGPFIDERIPLYVWAVENTGKKTGRASDTDIKQNHMLMYPSVRGVRHSLITKYISPLYQWCGQIAEKMNSDPVVVAHDLGSFRTNLHIIEAQKKQEEDIIKRQNSALMNMDMNEYNAASEDLRLFRARQKGEPEGKFFKIFGGKSKATVENELQLVLNTYGQEIVTQAVDRFGNALSGIVSEMIRAGVIGSKDVANFPAYAYFTPLYVREDFETGAPNDPYIADDELREKGTPAGLISPRTLFHRQGSIRSAVDCWDALNMMLVRASNSIGSKDFGQSMIDAYNYLASEFKKGEPNITKAVVGRVTYYNGLAVQKESAVNNLRDTNNRLYNKILERADCRVRILEETEVPVLDEQGNPVVTADGKSVTRTESVVVPYLVWFNKEEITNIPEEPRRVLHNVIQPNGMRVTVPTSMRSHDAEHTALRAPFVKYEYNKFQRTIKKGTTALAAGYTTYRPFFAIVNFMRDVPERLLTTASHTYSAENGQPISGAMVATLNASYYVYMPYIQYVAVTGKTNHVPSIVSKYMNEFMELGIMNSASIRAELKHNGDSTYAFLENAVKEYGNNAEIKELMDKMWRGARAPFRQFAESFYAVPPATLYMAFRTLGASPKQAALYVLDQMDLSRRGKISKAASPYVPYIPSIMNTVLNLTGSLGISSASVKHVRSKDVWKDVGKGTIGIGLMTYGVFLALIPFIAANIGDGDPEKGYKYLDTIDLSDLSYIPIAFGGVNRDGIKNEAFKLQVGFGIGQILWTLAVATNRVWRGVADWSEVASAVGLVLVRNMMFVSLSTGSTDKNKDPGFENVAQDFLETICPQVIRPIFEVAENRTYYGAAIHEHYPKEFVEKYDQGKYYTAQGWIDIARNLRKATKGTIVESLGNMYPEDAKQLVTSYMPGIIGLVHAPFANNELMIDKDYAGNREAMGAYGTTLGATSLFMTLGSLDRKLSYYYENYYTKLVAESGIGKLISDKGGIPITKQDKTMYPKFTAKSIRIMKVMTNPAYFKGGRAFTQQEALDYAKLHELHQYVYGPTGFTHKMKQLALKSGDERYTNQQIMDERDKLWRDRNNQTSATVNSLWINSDKAVRRYGSDIPQYIGKED